MKDDEKLSFVELLIWQILAGLGSGFVGFILYGILEPLIFGFLDLSGSVLYGLCAAYFSTYAGIAIVSIISLKEFITKSQVFKIILYTFPILLLNIYFIVFSTWADSWFFGAVLLPFPLLGLVFQFNRFLKRIALQS